MRPVEVVLRMRRMIIVEVQSVLLVLLMLPLLRLCVMEQNRCSCPIYDVINFSSIIKKKERTQIFTTLEYQIYHEDINSHLNIVDID